jgi:tetratricopeptide (TPR) repeat protein
VKQRLSDAEGAVKTALKVFGSDDHSSRLNVALNVRAGIAALRGSFEECIQYTDQVLLSEPDNEIAKQNRGLALYELDRHEEAVFMLTSIRDTAIQTSIAVPLADSYLKLNQPLKAKDVLLPHFHPERADEQQLQAAEVLLDSATRRGAASELDELVGVITKYWPNDAVASALIASKEFPVGRREKAIHRMKITLEAATAADRSMLSLHLARMYHDIREYPMAIQHLEAGSGTVTAETPSVDRYIHALFRVGRFDRALTLARAVRGSSDTAGKVTELEADILTQQGDVDAAALLFERRATRAD